MLVIKNKTYEGEEEIKKIDSILFRMKKDLKQRPVFQLTKDERDLARHLIWRKRYVKLKIQQQELADELENQNDFRIFTMLDNKRKENGKEIRQAYRKMNLIRPKFTITKYF